jgi:RNA polymerase sigma-70 factor (ECF subfamily)
MNDIVRARFHPSKRSLSHFPRSVADVQPALVIGISMPADSLQRDSVPPDFGQLIVEVARDGNRAAFGELFEHFGPRLKTYFVRAGVPAARAEELAQETMLSVWRKATYFDPTRAGASTWIFVIARNLRIDMLRRARSEQVALPDPFEEPEVSAQAEEIVAAGEREMRVREALAQLSEEQAAVIRFSFFNETPHADIAATLGIPLGTVKSRIRLAMVRLRDLLGDI